MAIQKTVSDRFHEKYIVSPNGCFIWTDALSRGYGRIKIGRLHRLAHRVAYEIHVGPIPAGMCLDHTCRIHACVNWRHLEAVTTAENNRRAAAGRELPSRCKRGHSYTSDNTRDRGGYRACRQCIRLKGREYDRKRRGGV
jgi:hypothetical protein